MKWIDDITTAETIKLKECLEKIPNFIGPRNIHEQNDWILPANKSKVQSKLIELEDYTNRNLMSLNSKKTKIQPFNFSRKFDFLPQVSVKNEPLEVVYSTRLLGVIFNSNCKWDDHVDFIVQKAKQKSWTLRRLKSQGASIQTLIELYKLFIRQVL